MECRLSTIQVENKTLNTKDNLKEKRPPPPQETKGKPCLLHDVTSHWLHGNSIPKIGGHYFWPGLIAFLRTP